MLIRAKFEHCSPWALAIEEHQVDRCSSRAVEHRMASKTGATDGTIRPIGKSIEKRSSRADQASETPARCWYACIFLPCSISERFEFAGSVENRLDELFVFLQGLVEAACTRPRRRSADDSCLVVPSESPLPDEELDQIRDPTELKEIIVNQRKFIQQLQLRIRVNTPDLIQLPNMEKLAKQNQVDSSSFPSDEQRHSPFFRISSS